MLLQMDIDLQFKDVLMDKFINLFSKWIPILGYKIK